MANKSKRAENSSLSTVDFGKARKARMERWKAKKLLEGTSVRTIPDAACALIDRGLEADGVR